MKTFCSWGSFRSRMRCLLSAAEAASGDDPALHEAAGLVYVGDVYALREEIRLERPDDGWGSRCYNCDSGVPLL